MSKRIVKAIRIALGMLRQEMGSAKMIMGYLLGLTFLALGANDFLRYAMETREPVNICEPFIVAANQGMACRFWVLGYLLVIGDAPFVKGNAYMVLYRSGRRVWNMGMLLYVFLQALLYTICLATVSVAASTPFGFPGELWSSPVYMLATVASNAIAEKYHIYFDGVAMMEYMTVFQAFGITFLYMLCYFVFLGVLLYLCNLTLGSFWGLAAVSVAHLGGVMLSFAGSLHPSPAYYVDSTGSHWRYPCRMLIFILIMTIVSLVAVKRADIQKR
ncbi:MAG: hypothetical protein K2P65_09185 [Lachnospiraceae bacterium]|nr:hypothetical protein [Lachnospiraceae bacterium]